MDDQSLDDASVASRAFSGLPLLLLLILIRGRRWSFGTGSADTWSRTSLSNPDLEVGSVASGFP